MRVTGNNDTSNMGMSPGGKTRADERDFNADNLR
jgi:hypothetical protein